MTTDKRDWRNPAEHSPSWEKRTKILCALVKPNESVLEFGAGKRAALKYLLPSCKYTSHDICRDFGADIVCDLNAKKLHRFPRADVAMFSGVLEYIADVERLIKSLKVSAVVLSYAASDVNYANRAHNGWVNSYTTVELVDMMQKCGFGIAKYNGEIFGQVIYRFER